MEIKGKVHCLFEQSGTFKREFIKLGIPAEDYDIQDNFGETDHKIDLFGEIKKAYEGGQSIFDSITCEDLIIAFFPCIYFSALSQMSMSFGCFNYRGMSIKEKSEAVLARSRNRERFFRLLVQMFSVVMQQGNRMIVENPWSEQTFLKANFIMPPTMVDNDRTRRGDFFKKPTAFWFIGCKPTYGVTEMKPREFKTIMAAKQSGRAGLCSEERSMISPDYARNFICDFILGREQRYTQMSLFEFEQENS